MRVTILGGAGGMGAWFARFFKANKYDVHIVDSSANTARVAAELGVDFTRLDLLTADSAQLIAALRDAEIVLVSVPIDSTGRVIERVGPLVAAGSLLMDVTSVKREPVAAMVRCTREDVEVLGTHPLFGPSATNLHGMPVIFVPVRTGPRYEQIVKLFRGTGAKLEILTAAEHDELMVVILGLPHFVLFSLGITLKELGLDVDRARHFMGPMYAVVLDFVGRLLHQDPRLYAEIQTSLEMQAVHEAFIATAVKLAALVSAQDKARIIQELEAAKAHFGDTERAMQDSDRIIEEKLNLVAGKTAVPPNP